ncbi:hypothetical protein Ga0123461_2216 [Mariprofundus aestuarium]|uniref:Uncharacterized protein n=1 Tax=Mariprofundus aestuarium TaxID=1921086 RepID=A0A2K8L459_MARES|nr:hypothetical protein [Mariprofundus aestuarium]ATX80621.1 hypothetical protein Ga0123461_2216 [Mariprofundus aestuarium]
MAKAGALIINNELAACVASVCRRRKNCKSYAAVPLDQIVKANAEAKGNGHEVFEDFPLFESAFKKTELGSFL